MLGVSRLCMVGGKESTRLYFLKENEHSTRLVCVCMRIEVVWC